MKNNNYRILLKKTLGYGFIFIAMALIVIMLSDKIIPNVYIPYEGIVVLLCCVTVFSITGTLILASILTRKELKANMMNTILWVIFLAYLIALLKVLFIDRTDFSANNYIYHKEMRATNMVPFATIKLFIRSWQYGYLNKGLVITNLIGNIVIFVPMVLLLWCMFKVMRKTIVIIIVNFLIIVGVELCQYITKYGSCDVDDIILNMIGVVIGCILVRTKWFNKLCRGLYIIKG